LIILTLISTVSSKEGFDAIQAISKTTFNCLKQNGKSFFIARIWRSSGKVDSTGIQNIVNAREAGWSDVGAYVFPCASSSCPSAAAQIQSAIASLKKANAVVNYVWVDLETYGSLWWDHTKNRQFIENMVKEIKALGYKPGIYASKTMWNTIVGSDYKGLSSYPLWWATYNNKDSMAGYTAFGGWSTPYIHQYHGTETGPCSVSMDLNYKQ
uniref:Glycoside hydrolase n=1 Tax=Syphacia muris TaxID=451379 RepID=A0A0N5A7Z9_9BILA